MLEMRPHCEKCSTLLPFDSREALICSYECTFCQSCGEGALAFRCPNCNGELLRRPSRKLPSGADGNHAEGS